MPEIHHNPAGGRRKSAVLANMTCVLFWGFSFISIKIAVEYLPPMTLGAARFAIAIVLLFFLYRFIPVKQGQKNPITPLKEDLPLLLCSGLTGVTFYFFAENNGVLLVTASEASIIVASIPIFAMIADWILAKVSTVSIGLGLRHWFGAFISVAGVALVAGVSFSLSGSITGYIYMGVAALSWVAYGLLTRPLFERGRARTYIVFWQNLFGFLGFLPFAILERSSWIMPPVTVIFHVVFLGVCCSAMGYWLYAHSLEVLGVSVSAVFLNLVPVVTVIAGFFLLGDRLAALQWVGGALVLIGVYLTVLPKTGLPKSLDFDAQ